MTIQIKKAERKQAKLRLELSSPSGWGKTMSALLMAKWLAKWDMSKVCIIDTESKSSHLYSHLWDYSVIELDPNNVSTAIVIEAFEAAESAWFEVIIFDSSSLWRDRVLDKNNEIAKRLYNNSFMAWKETNIYYQKLINHMLASPAHVIVTARSKSDWAMETNDKWKVVPRKIGLKDSQRDGFDFEMTVCLRLDEFHYATASKDRTWLFDWKEPFIITEDTGKQLLDWCESWVAVEPKPELKIVEQQPEQNLPEISDERFAKACEVIKDWKATVESLTQHFKLSENQTNIINELFMKKA